MPEIFPASDFEQGSEKWFALRMGIPTASEFKNFMGAPRGSKSFLDKFNLKKSSESGELNDAVETYLCRKVSERFEGPQQDPQSFSSFETEQGKLNEKLARKWLAMEFETEITEVAFIKTDDGAAGCSPDGLLGDDCGVEIKCPQGPKQASYLLNGELPDDYLHQVHGSLYVTGRKQWYFVSYRDGWPTLLLTVQRDEAIMSRMAESIAQFNRLLVGAFEKLNKLP
jgi:hypothetical protein